MDATNPNSANPTQANVPVPSTPAPTPIVTPPIPNPPPPPQPPIPTTPPPPPPQPVTTETEQPVPIPNPETTPPPPPPNSPTPIPEEPQFSKKPEPPQKGKLFVAAGPIIVVVSFIASFMMFQNNSQKTGTVSNLTNEPQTIEQHLVEIPKSSFIQVLANAPKNPDQVDVICEDTGETLQSEVATDCPNIKFTWFGEKIIEPEASISGYFVYLGENNNDPVLTLKNKSSDFTKAIVPETQGQFVTQNFHVASGLEKGKTYYFAVSVKSDSKTPEYRVGFSQIDTISVGAQIAKVLFVLNYE